MNSSPVMLPTKTQDFLYHATFPDCVDSIKQLGILPNVDGHVFLTNKSEYAVGFIRLRNGLRTYVEDELAAATGDPLTHVSQSHTAIVCTILAGLLDEDRLLRHEEEEEPSGFFPKDLVTYRYPSIIPPSFIVSFDTFPFPPLTLESFP